MSTIVSDIRASSARSLWLDSGDSFQGAPVFNMWHGEVELRTLSLMGMDAAVVGNHEFDLGTNNLFNQINDWAQFPLLAGNYLYDDPIDPTEASLRDVVQPYVIFDLDGLKVGVIGMGNNSSMTGILEGGNSLGIRPREDGEVVEELVRLLRPVVDVVVVVSHLGLDEDEGLGSHQVVDDNEKLPLEGVDVILGGHLHIVLNPPKTLASDEVGNKTVLAHSGAFAKYVGRLDVVVRVGEDNSDPERRSRVTAFSYTNIPITNKEGPVGDTRPTVEDPKIVDFLWPYSIEINRELDLNGVFAYTDNGGILRNNITGGDSQLGNLVARSMQLRTGVEADFALTNSLGIRADFDAGPLTVEQMFNVFPFENSITVMFLSGSEIQEMLDFVARRSAGRGCRTQAQVAGIWWDMVCGGDTCPGGASACAKDIVLGENCRAGNPAGPIDFNACAPVEPTGLYKVAVNDFIARGGSGFEVLKRNTSKQDTGVPLREALVDFLRRQPKCADSVVDMTTGMQVVDAYGEIACLDQAIEPPDGRIRAVFE
jgi:5'-nucleotidase